MEYREFGKTGMKVSALGFGGSEIRGVDVGTVDRLLGSALDAGLNVIDTAACYGDSEELIGKAVSHRRSDYFVFSKCGHASGLSTPDWDPRTVRDSIDRSLKRLKTDYVDLMQLHSCGVDVLQEGSVIEELQKAKQAGKIRFLGYSGDREAARSAVELGVFDSLQTSINVADQSVLDEVLPLAVARGMGVIAKRPIANVAWQYQTMPEVDYYVEYWRRFTKLQFPFTKLPVSEAVGVALRFTLSTPGVSTAIVGTQNPGRWQQNAAYVDAGSLPTSEYEAIRDAWRRAAEPGWMGQT
ncbi:aryl-alcohol dehydrogenase-like predicted oxidoreductase [Alicyclobacillus sacchari]|uniref:Aryl-alcohol dehydrogenase-like predicted oxidoreductase n=1 Tax=Alicyclobacillus sacchari TaxID=392010 RepID=A0A4V3HF36_9BACL|nr:aldo/keto reductase [Alicyclobacillus sacchari]TDY51351.1 aryl-alcohol dehydrogenase-like predicted oxidoreductase [Alicyclobacillus sacchari]GMA56666.1 aldo/keto reductase [Alicyclobacillus sacchari]